MITANTMYASQDTICDCECCGEILKGEHYVMIRDRQEKVHIVRPECGFGFLKQMEVVR